MVTDPFDGPFVVCAGCGDTQQAECCHGGPDRWYCVDCWDAVAYLGPASWDNPYQEAHQRALSAPLPAERLAGVPRDQGAAQIHLRAVHLETERRAGPEFVAEIRARGRAAAEDIEQPWHD